MMDKGQNSASLAAMLDLINATDLSGAHDHVWQRRAPSKMVMAGF
jgi:hypothetical protein